MVSRYSPLLVLLALGACKTEPEEVVEEPTIDEMSAKDVLIRASLDMRGVRPSIGPSVGGLPQARAPVPVRQACCQGCASPRGARASASCSGCRVVLGAGVGERPAGGR